MSAEVFAEWWHRQGYRVVRTASSYWYEASPRVFQAFPYHWLIQPTERELFDFLRQNLAVGLRYSTPAEAPVGSISYHAVYDQPTYTLESLDRRSRQNVRTGLKNCQIEAIPLERLAEEGWYLEADTSNRQGRQAKLNKETWRQRCLAASDLPGFEAWGALIEGRLVASLLSFQMDDCCELIFQQCDRDFLSARVNNALTFVVTQTMVERPEIRSIFYTLQSLDAPPTIDEFKFRMGYIPRPVRQRVVFHPWFSPFANGFSHAAIRQVRQRFPENHTFAKAEGMLRFYQQGKRPLDQQDWPECLREFKEMLHHSHAAGSGSSTERAGMQQKP